MKTCYWIIKVNKSLIPGHILNRIMFMSTFNEVGAKPYSVSQITALIRKDSLDMTDQDRALLRDAVDNDPHDRILITHGTDTMVETAKELLGIEGKVIVITGAMEPAGFKTSDAVFNVGCAVGAIQCLDPGVYIAMNGRIYDPHEVKKNRAAGRFEPL